MSNAGFRAKRAWGFFLFFVLFSRFLISPLPAEEASVETSPLFLADIGNPNDFSLFANGGWDGNWYVGFNTCWIQKITVPAKGSFDRAFIGAKLGRMKNIQIPGKAPWEKKAFPGQIYAGISSTPTWNRSQSYFLASTEDIPLEPDGENAVEGTGESRWFWAEVPLKLIQFEADNYLALWSPSQNLTSVSSSPILAAGWGTKEVNSWVNHDVKGLPPADPQKAISTPLTIFEPAIALKLIPAKNSAEFLPKVKIIKIETGKSRGKSPAPKIVWSSIEGQTIERAWLEVSTDEKKWTKFGRFLWNAPFCFTVKTEEIPIGSDGKSWIRVMAADSFESVGASLPVNLFETR